MQRQLTTNREINGASWSEVGPTQVCCHMSILIQTQLSPDERENDDYHLVVDDLIYGLGFIAESGPATHLSRVL